MEEPKKIKKPVKKIVSDVIFSVVMGILGLFVLFALLDKTIGFSIGGRHLVWVLSPSMQPTIEQRSYIIVKDCDASEVKVNDIIMFVSEDAEIYGKNNTHRVIEITPEGNFVTKGDNNIARDNNEVRPEQVIAKYEGNVPFLTGIGRFYATPAGYITTVGIIVALSAVWFSIDLKDKKKEAKKELMNQMVQEEVARLEKEASLKEGKENEDEKESK